MERNLSGRRSVSGRGSRIAARAVASVVVVLAGLVAVGCGSSADDADASVPELGFMNYRDGTGVSDKVIERCNKQAKGRWKIKYLPMGPTTDAAREQLTRRLAAEDESIDIIHLDTIWTAEFSDAGWLVDVTSRVEPIAETLVPAALTSTHYREKYWAMPVGTQTALLYYRTDLVKRPPTTWEDLKVLAAAAQKQRPDISGYVFQGNQYEGSTVAAVELISAAGATVVGDDRETSVVEEGDGTEHALTYLRGLFADGITPKVVTTFQEEEARLAFQNGTAVFMRNWPYAYTLMNTEPASKVKKKFDVVPLPPFEGRTSASVLGGQNYGISSFSRWPDLAWEAVLCMSDKSAQKANAISRGNLPTLESLYDDPDVKRAMPYLATSRKSLETGVNRPVSPYYGDITIPIFRAWNDVAADRISPADAVDRMDNSIQLALEGRAEI